MRNGKRTKLALFPIEIGPREILPRINLAIELTPRGWTSVIGHKFSIDRLIKLLPYCGVYIYKDGSRNAYRYLKNAKELDYTTISTDEEFYLHKTIDDVNEVPIFFDYNTAKLVDYFVTSNSTTHATIERAIGKKALFLGNLRGAFAESMYQHNLKNDVRKINVSGSKVLLSSNAGIALSEATLFTHLAILDSLTNMTKLQNATQLFTRYQKSYERLREILLAFELLKDHGANISIRPHPSESEFAWVQLIGDDRLSTNSSSIFSSVNCFQLICGFHCGTLVDLFMAGLPVIDLTLKRNFLNDSFNHDILKSQSSFRATDIDEDIFYRSEPSGILPHGVDITRTLNDWVSLFSSIGGDRIYDYAVLEEMIRELLPLKITGEIKSRYKGISLQDINFALRIKFQSKNSFDTPVIKLFPDSQLLCIGPK